MVAFSKNFDDSNYSTELRLGYIKGRSQVNFGGRATGVGTTKQTLWNYGGIYTYLSANTQLYVSSSNTGDTSVNLLIFGLNFAGEFIALNVVTNGQNQVAISGVIWRVFAVQVVGSVAPLGDLYLAEADTLSSGVPATPAKVKAMVTQGENVSSMALYTVPSGKALLLKKQRMTVSSGKSAILYNRTRFKDSIFLEGGVFDVFEKALEFNYEYGVPAFPAFTDIEIAVVADATGANISTAIDCELINV